MNNDDAHCCRIFCSLVATGFILVLMKHSESVTFKCAFFRLSVFNYNTNWAYQHKKKVLGCAGIIESLVGRTADLTVCWAPHAHMALVND